MIDTLRIACVQYQQQPVAGFEAFSEQVTSFVRWAQESQVDLVVFPEMLSLQLLSASPSALAGMQAVTALSAHTEALVRLTCELARRYRVHVLLGSHIAQDPDGAVRNRALFADPDGSFQSRPKIHITPNERAVWQVRPGDDVRPVYVNGVAVGIQICYDCEFSALSECHGDAGCEVLAVPFCTEDRHGYLRVRRCAEARAVEWQSFVAIAGNVGVLRGVPNMDVNYAQSAVFAPSDIGFPRDGVVQEAVAGIETMIIAELDLVRLRRARAHGSVTNLQDRRPELYRHWRST